MSRALLQQALDAIEYSRDNHHSYPTTRRVMNDAIDALKAELAKPEPYDLCTGELNWEPPQQKPLTPQEWWDAAPWNYDMDSRPKNQRSLIKNDAGNITTACCSICERDIAWLPLPEQK